MFEALLALASRSPFPSSGSLFSSRVPLPCSPPSTARPPPPLSLFPLCVLSFSRRPLGLAPFSRFRGCPPFLSRGGIRRRPSGLDVRVDPLTYVPELRIRGLTFCSHLCCASSTPRRSLAILVLGIVSLLSGGTTPTSRIRSLFSPSRDVSCSFFFFFSFFLCGFFFLSLARISQSIRHFILDLWSLC